MVGKFLLAFFSSSISKLEGRDRGNENINTMAGSALAFQLRMPARVPLHAPRQREAISCTVDLSPQFKRAGKDQRHLSDAKMANRLQMMAGRDVGIREHHTDLFLYFSWLLHKTIPQKAYLAAQQMSVVTNICPFPVVS